MKQDVFVTKGMRVHVKALVAQKLGTYSLAGAQMKVAAREVEFTGRVAHVRGDHPTDPKEVGVWFIPEDPDVTFPLFAGLEIQPTACAQCSGFIEVGPFPMSAIKAVLT